MPIGGSGFTPLLVGVIEEGDLDVLAGHGGWCPSHKYADRERDDDTYPIQGACRGELLWSAGGERRDLEKLLSATQGAVYGGNPGKRIRLPPCFITLGSSTCTESRPPMVTGPQLWQCAMAYRFTVMVFTGVKSVAL